MRNDESLPSARPPVGYSSNSGIKLPAPARSKETAPAGGVPPMFASKHAQSPGPRGEAMER